MTPFWRNLSNGPQGQGSGPARSPVLLVRGWGQVAECLCDALVGIRKAGQDNDRVARAALPARPIRTDGIHPRGSQTWSRPMPAVGPARYRRHLRTSSWTSRLSPQDSRSIKAHGHRLRVNQVGARSLHRSRTRCRNHLGMANAMTHRGVGVPSVHCSTGYVVGAYRRHVDPRT